MTPGEVKGLQALALAHGGSLTINPDTGLTEAGFLEKILPVAAGAALTYFSGGTLAPWASAMIVGGGYGAATGSVEKGLMAGLSAYGGAGLTSGLASAGSQAAAEQAGTAAAEGITAAGQEAATQAATQAGQEAATQAGQEAATQAATSGVETGAGDVFAGYSPTGSAAGTNSATAGTGAGTSNVASAQNYINAQNFPGLTPEQIQASQSGLPEAVKQGATPAQYARGLGQASSIQGTSYGSQVAQGLPQAGSVLLNNPGAALSVAGTVLQPDQPGGPAGYQEDEYDRRLKGYKLSSDYKAYEAPRPNPYYRPTYAAEGGVMESFDDENGSDTVGMASGGIARYRSKGQVNVLQDYLDRQEKEESKQKQLSTNPSSYFPDVGIFRDPDVDTARKDALTASMIRLGKAGKGAGIKTVALPKTSIKGLGDVSGATPEIEEAADGGIMRYNLGGYSDGGRMLKGPGDGMSDSIPASIAGKQPARLADGEFVIPADVVSHLGNGSTDAGAKKLYSMMDNIRKARTGKKKQAPQVNVDKYLPGKKKASGGIAGYAEGGVIGYASGGIAGYADGGEIASVYESYLGRTPSAAEIKSWQDTGASYNTISQGIRNSPEAKTFASDKANAEKLVTSLYKDQLGRAPDPEGLKFWSESLAKGTPLDQISKGINQSLEGQNFDTQYITSLYRQNLARNPEQAGYQYWLSEAQAAGYTPKEIEAILKQSATVEQAARKMTPGEKATEMELAALESDPFGGRYATKSIYDLLPDAVNVSSIGEQKAQFVNPVTQQPYVTNYGEGTWAQKIGADVLNAPQVQAAIDVARSNGTLNQAGYNTLIADLNAAKTMDQTRAALAKPQGQVVIDTIYGQQIGENVDLAAARTEAEGRQGVLTAQDPGYYQSNPTLSAAYQQAGLTVPFNYDAYKGVDTRTGQANVVTPQNFQNQQNQLVKELTTYKPTYPTLGRRTTNLPDSVRDPYSDEGLKFLYGQMMDQYGPPPAGFINPATFQTTPYTYKPPAPNNLVLNTPVADASKPATVTEAAPAAVVTERTGGLLAIDRKKRAKTKPKRGLLAA
jgi:hypothetical protein